MALAHAALGEFSWPLRDRVTRRGQGMTASVPTRSCGLDAKASVLPCARLRSGLRGQLKQDTPSLRPAPRPVERHPVPSDCDPDKKEKYRHGPAAFEDTTTWRRPRAGRGRRASSPSLCKPRAREALLEQSAPEATPAKPGQQRRGRARRGRGRRESYVLAPAPGLVRVCVCVCSRARGEAGGAAPR